MAEQQYDNELRGALWEKERKSDKAPHFEGKCQIRGEEFQVSVWDTGEGGRRPAFKLRFKPMDEVLAEREAYKAKQGGSGGGYSRRAPAQAERPREQNLPLDAGMIDDEIPW